MERTGALRRKEAGDCGEISGRVESHYSMFAGDDDGGVGDK